MADQKRDRRLTPARRGDTIAGGATILGVVLFISATSLASNAGLIGWNNEGALLRTLPAISTVLTGVAFLWTFLRDWRWLNREERDIDNLLEKDAFHQDPRKVLETQGARRFAVQTILDDRVAKLLGYPNEEPLAPAMRDGELRTAAIARVATLGSFARFISGLLLLLTVLGTFVGVKEALPQISTAFLPQSGGQVAGQSLHDAMQSIANAFGSNLVALIGSISLGFVSFGFGLARQNMLARLEQATTLYVYPKVRKDHPDDVLRQAMVRLSEATTELTKMGSYFATFGDALEDLGSTVDESLRQTRDAIQALLAKQALQIEEQERRTVDRLERQLSDTAVAVQQSVALYSTLAGSIDAQGRMLATTNSVLERSLTESAEGRKQFAHYAEPLARSVEARLDQLQRAADQQATATERIGASYQEIAKQGAELIGTNRATADAIRAADEAHRMRVANIDQSVATAVAGILSRPIEQLSVSISALDSRLAEPARAPLQSQANPSAEIAQLLRDLRDAARQPLWRRFIGRRSA